MPPKDVRDSYMGGIVLMVHSWLNKCLRKEFDAHAMQDIIGRIAVTAVPIVWFAIGLPLKVFNPAQVPRRSNLMLDDRSNAVN